MTHLQSLSQNKQLMISHSTNSRENKYLQIGSFLFSFEKQKKKLLHVVVKFSIMLNLASLADNFSFLEYRTSNNPQTVDSPDLHVEVRYLDQFRVRCCG
jgi:hypothetical protein